MAALSTLAALPLIGNVSGGTLTMFKCAKAVKYVRAVTKVVSNAATFTVAAAGDVKSIKNICQNIKDGKIFTKENLLELANIGLNTFTMMCSGKNTISSGKELGGMLKKDVANAWSKVKGGLKNFNVNKSRRYSETEITNIINDLKGDGFKNNPLRQAYENEVAGLKAYGEELLASGMKEDKVAQKLNQARRDLGIKYKNATPQPLRNYIYEINMGRYGDKLGPTYGDMIKSGKSNMDIINSSSRPNSDIDSLLSGFEEWLRRQ